MTGATSADQYVFLDQSCDDLNVDEFSNIDTSLLMALLQDTQTEGGYGDEKLQSMIPSLLPEIMNHESCLETEDSASEDYLFSEVDDLESCSTSPHHHKDFEWMDMEIGYPCEMAGYFTEEMVEVGGLEDYAQACYGMSMEEDDFIALWQ